METRNELGIKRWWTISMEEIQEWDVVEIIPTKDYPNRRYVVSDTYDWKLFIDSDWKPIPDDLEILWIIRWYPSDDDLLNHRVNLTDLKLDFPEEEWQMDPVFTWDMLMDYEFVDRLTFTVSREPDRWVVRLHNRGYAFRKEWIIWDSLKFYPIGKWVSYFI